MSETSKPRCVSCVHNYAGICELERPETHVAFARNKSDVDGDKQLSMQPPVTPDMGCSHHQEFASWLASRLGPPKAKNQDFGDPRGEYTCSCVAMSPATNWPRVAIVGSDRVMSASRNCNNCGGTGIPRVFPDGEIPVLVPSASDGDDLYDDQGNRIDMTISKGENSLWS